MISDQLLLVDAPSYAFPPSWVYRCLLGLASAYYLASAGTPSGSLASFFAAYSLMTWSLGLCLWVSSSQPIAGVWYSAVFFHYFFLYLVLFVVVGLLFFRKL